MKKVFRTRLLSLLMGMASAAAFAADPAEFVESASAKGIAEVVAVFGSAAHCNRLQSSLPQGYVPAR